ncbi:SRPBCC domain-containing protein [Kribbella solani]|uniref:Carbon monoxide dehydrogenase subunit G n=1 Tax=Kribbella solani TaxID=236067 RepID=A0A841DS72_9ACTN|nr:carbon monoxide dehydrogenase subunit G [Kribbella solani]
MKLEHAFVVPAPIGEVWDAFNDLERVVPCFPGATLDSYEGDAFTGSCKVKLGPVSLLYTGTGTFVERNAADHHAVIDAKGKDKRGNGTATARVTTKLTEAGPGSTRVTVDTDLTITGRPAQFGRGLIQDVSTKLLNQFTTCLKSKLTTEPTTSTESVGSTDVGGAATPQGPGGAATPQGPGGSPTSDGSATPDPSLGRGSPSDAKGSSSAQPDAGKHGDALPDDSPQPEDAVALDLVGTVLPLLARRAAPYLIGATLALILRRLIRH